jgi:hypothetical protein
VVQEAHFATAFLAGANMARGAEHPGARGQNLPAFKNRPGALTNNDGLLPTPVAGLGTFGELSNQGRPFHPSVDSDHGRLHQRGFCTSAANQSKEAF